MMSLLYKRSNWKLSPYQIVDKDQRKYHLYPSYFHKIQLSVVIAIEKFYSEYQITKIEIIISVSDR